MKNQLGFSAARFKRLVYFITALLPMTGLAQGHFIFKSNTEDYYVIVVQSAALNNIPLEAGDEIGVFTPAGLCVGATVVQSTNDTAITAWQDDSITPAIDGYRDGETIAFRVWDVSNQSEFVINASFVRGNGSFGDGPYAQVDLNLQVNFAPRISLEERYTFHEDGVLLLNLNAYVLDENHDDAALVWTLAGGQDITGTLAPGNVVRFASAANWFGAESFTFSATDPLGASDTALVTIEVLPVQDQPKAATLTSPVGGAPVDTLNVTLRWQASLDPDGDALSYLVVYGTLRTLDAQVDSSRTTDTFFTIPNALAPSRRYYWRVVTFDGFSAGVPSAIDSFVTSPRTAVAERPDLPLQFGLEQNYPNPFSLSQSGGITMIRFSLPRPAFVALNVHNALGQKIASVSQGHLPAGQHEVAWNGVTEIGQKISSGVYWIHFSAGEFQAMRKIIVMK